MGASVNADALGNAVLIDAALFAGTAVLLSANVVLESELIVEQHVNSVLNVF